MKMIKINELRKEPLKIALIVLLIIQFCLIAFSNITLIDKNLDNDNCLIFNHVVEIGRQKTILLPEWDYLTTLQWDCSSAFALPYYLITHNVILSFGLSNITFLICFLGLIFFLFKGEDSLYPLLCANLLIIPFRIGMLDYYNMLFFAGAHYIIRATIPLLLTGLLLYMNNRPKERIRVSVVFLSAIYLGLLLLCAMSSGIYVPICGLFPVFAVYMVYKFFRWERVPRSIIFLALSSLVLIFLGWKINMAVMGGARGNGMTFCSIYQMLASVSSCFFGIFELYGATTESFELPVLSMEGIQLLAKYALTMVMLVSGIVCILRYVIHPKNICREKSLRVLLLLSIFVWNLLVLIISFPRGGSTTYEYRYHLIGSLPLMCVMGILLIDSIKKLQVKQQTCIYVAGYLAILFLCAVSYKDLYFREDPNTDLKELCSYTKELEVDHIYLFDEFHDSNISRVIDDTSSYLYLSEDGKTWADDYYSRYVGTPMQTSNVVVVVNDERYQFGDSFEIAGHTLIKFASVANRSLYYFAEDL